MAFRGQASVSSSGGTFTSVITVSGIGGTGPQLNDLVLLCPCCAGATTTFTYPSGFAAVPGLSNVAITNGAFSVTLGIAYKVAGGSEPSTYTITSSVNDFQTAMCRVYSGRSTTSPFTAVATTSNTAVTGSGAGPSTYALSLTGLTAASGDDLVIFVGDDHTATNSTDTWDISLTGWANNNNAFAANNNAVPMLAIDQVNAVSGATGTLAPTETLNKTARTIDYGAYVLALTQAPPATQAGLMGGMCL